MARRAWEEIDADPRRTKVKRYCYALRPALTLQWLSINEGLPPMDVASLCRGLDERLISNLAELFAMKFSGGEGDLIDRRPVLDKLISDNLADKAPRPTQAELASETFETADRLFRRLL